jgi:hypothetical protein
MAKKAGGSTGSATKSQAIRDYAEQNPEAGPTAVAEALKQQGFDVTPAFVSTVRSKGQSKKTASKGNGRKKPGRPKGSGKKAQGSKAGSGDSLSLDMLLRAKRLAEQMGGIQKAKAALDAYARIAE